MSSVSRLIAYVLVTFDLDPWILWCGDMLGAAIVQ